MKQSEVLARIKVAGYHDDTGSLVRLQVENRVSYEAAQQAFKEGKKNRENGLKCNCLDCNPSPK